MSDNINPNISSDTTERATRRHDPISHITWLEFDGKPAEQTRAALKAAGWRWSGYRKQWYCNQRFPTIPACVAVEDGGECDYASERGERLEWSAQRHAALSNAAYQRSNQIASLIPLGQPILVGHHSEGRHRRDLDRIHSAMDKSVAEAKTAERLSEKAASSRAHQSYYQHNVGAAHRRLDRLSADLRAMRRHEERRAAQLAARGDEPTDSDREYTRRIESVAAEVAELEQRIADAGGILADRLRVEVGDTIKINGFIGIVKRVNPKTFTVDIPGITPAWTLKLDRSQLQAILRKHDGSSVEAQDLGEVLAQEQPERQAE